MIDLKCKCTTCHHNQHSNCAAKNIHVNKGTNCLSYIEKRSGDVEFADEIMQPLVRSSTDIECHAKCMFAREGVCVANGITVGEIKNNATCETFLPE